MTKIVGQNSEVQFGKEAKDAPEDWRDDEDLMNEEDPDDEEHWPAEPGVIDILGFDPDELWGDEEVKRVKHLPGQHDQSDHGRDQGGIDEDEDEYDKWNAKYEEHKRIRKELEDSFMKGVDRRLAEQVFDGELSEERSKKYSRVMKRVVSKLPPLALKRMYNNVSDVSFFDSVKELTDYYKDRFGKGNVKEGHLVGGFWRHRKEINMGSIVLDGGYEHGRWNEDSVTAEIYAHELAHAYDHSTNRPRRNDRRGRIWGSPGDETISGGDDWKSAWKEEISGGSLSDYATTDSCEGFAEFGRLVTFHGEAVREQYPKCWKVWEDKGLVHKKGEDPWDNF